MRTARTTKLATGLQVLYEKHSTDVPFHGWHHIYFVTKKAVEFAAELNADRELVEAAALTHDLNYVARPDSQPDEGRELRLEHLTKAGFSKKEGKEIDRIIMQEDMATRSEHISAEAKALSDADTLFKALPVTPILFANHYLRQNNIDIRELADNRVIAWQKPLMEAGIYFYTQVASQKYLDWAKVTLQMWENVHAALDDPDVDEMLALAHEAGIV